MGRRQLSPAPSVLLGTHVWIWLMNGNERLGPQARKVIQQTVTNESVLVKAVLGAPVDGVGKPEPLKYLGPDVWSRRITQEHRCVYLVKADRVEFLQGRYHY